MLYSLDSRCQDILLYLLLTNAHRSAIIHSVDARVAESADAHV